MQRPRLLTEQLICGDYLDVATLMPPDSVDLVFGSPPNGIALDPFGGSGTSASVAKQNGRGYISVDIRQSQIELTQRRLEE